MGGRWRTLLVTFVLVAAFFVIYNTTTLTELERLGLEGLSTKYLNAAKFVQSNAPELPAVEDEADSLNASHLYIYVASAHVLPGIEPEHRYTLRLNVMARDLTPLSFVRPEDLAGLSCQSQSMETTPARLVQHLDIPHCQWNHYFIDCGFQDRVRTAQLVGLGGDAPLEVPITPPVTQPHHLVVCFARAFHFENWHVLLTVLEVYKRNGVDFFSLPITTMLEPVFRFLKAYNRDGRVHSKPGHLMPKIPGLPDPNAESDALNFKTSHHECLLEHRDSAEFLIFADTDDLVMSNADQPLYELVRQLALAEPQAAGFEFQWNFIQVPIPAQPLDFSMAAVFQPLVSTRLQPYGKSVVRPQRIRKAIVHNADSEVDRVAPFVMSKRPRAEAEAYHLRDLLFANDSARWRARPTPGPGHQLPASAQWNIDVLDETFRARTRQTKELREAMSALPTTPIYFERMRACWEQAFADMANKKTQCVTPCPLPRDGAHPRCVVLRTEYGGAALRLDARRARLYVPRQRQLASARSCHLDD